MIKLYVPSDRWVKVNGTVTPLADYVIKTRCGSVVAAGESMDIDGEIISNDKTTAIVEVVG